MFEIRTNEGGRAVAARGSARIWSVPAKIFPPTREGPKSINVATIATTPAEMGPVRRRRRGTGLAGDAGLSGEGAAGPLDIGWGNIVVPGAKFSPVDVL